MSNSGDKFRDRVAEQLREEGLRDGCQIRTEVYIEGHRVDILVTPVSDIAKLLLPKPTVISCKFQASAGSAEQKISYELDLLAKLTSGYDAVVAMGGNGWSLRVLEELENKAAQAGIRIVKLSGDMEPPALPLFPDIGGDL